MGWLDRGEPRVLDPESVVQVAEVMLYDGPLLVAALERDGIRAHGIEAADFVTKGMTRMRILVQAKDAQRATDVIEATAVKIKRPIL
jgi:hypothetical protein